ncbi:hypothetical protein WN944_024613 [Citrus x changshan-huyou]|uniref:Uncharacterized protein n=1 Tax=Citrus x changshan-huyou TaxID=2935761 RepID=A0AAP0QBF4_9ROSI
MNYFFYTWSCSAFLTIDAYSVEHCGNDEVCPSRSELPVLNCWSFIWQTKKLCFLGISCSLHWRIHHLVRLEGEAEGGN